MKRPTNARISQLIFLALFLFLFLQTEYRGNDQIPVAVNAFFRANPLTFAGTVLAVKRWVPILLPGLLMLLFSAIIGRLFDFDIGIKTGRIEPDRSAFELLCYRFIRAGAVAMPGWTGK